METHLLYPIVHAALEEFMRDTGATACWLSNVPRFPPAQVGLPDFGKDRQITFDVAPRATAGRYRGPSV